MKYLVNFLKSAPENWIKFGSLYITFIKKNLADICSYVLVKAPLWILLIALSITLQ